MKSFDRAGRGRFILSLVALIATLPAPALAQGFGQAMLVSGEELFVGESLFTSRPGYVYVYRKDGSGAWTQAARLEASDAAPNDHFGRALALAEGDLLVGATVSRQSGALYVFSKSGGEWRQTASLVPSDADTAHSFGRVGATDGRVVLMADWAADESRGAVYVFEKQGGTWRETAKLSASDAAPGDWFGSSIAIADGRIAVGARNRAQGRGGLYLFTRDGSAWREVAKLDAPDAAQGTQLGASVAIAGDAVLAGAPGQSQFLGAVHVFRQNGGAWAHAATVTPPAGTEPFGSFGEGLTVVGDEVWVGAPGVEEGRVLRLARSGNGWSHAGMLTTDRYEAGDAFGGAVAVNGATALVAAIGDDFSYGSAVVLERSGSEWAEAGHFVSDIGSLDAIRGATVECASGKAALFDCGSVDVLAFIPNDELGGARGAQLNDVWGWTDPENGTEWAIVGRYDGTTFVDVTNPGSPRIVANLPLTEGAQANSWRDMKVYQNHVFIVADGAGPHGMQVVDLTRLRSLAPGPYGPVTITADAHYDRIASAHNIVINEATGFAYAVGASSGGETCGGALHMIDIRQPLNPTFAGCFQDTATGNQRTGYSHDAQCVTYHGPDTTYRGHEMCFGSNETALSIADVTDKANAIAVSNAAYPNVGYTHQGWLDEQHEYFYMNDEGDEVSGTVPNTRTLVWDVRDLDDPILVKEYFGPSKSSDHNLYIKGDLMYQSNYVSGLRIVDISNRQEPKEVGYFDTVPWSDDPGFDGSWSNYPFFNSGTLVVTSGKEGLFLLKKRPTRVVS